MSDPQFPTPVEEQPSATHYYVSTRRTPITWVHWTLLAVTFFTTLVVGARLQHNFINGLSAFSSSENSLPMFPLSWIAEHPSRLLSGIPFSLAVMAILLAHELGHYLYARRYWVDATPPYFIPAPTLIGTLGAFIKIRSAFPSRKALFDIGIAGPIAGFVFAVPVTLVGLVLSNPLGKIPESDIHLGFPLLFRAIHWGLVTVGNKPVQDLHQMLIHPLAIAGWVGMFATSLNLLPGGQLDGGHLVYSWSPRAHKIITRLAIFALLPLAWYFWVGWLVWAIVLRVTGMRHPVMMTEDDELGRSRAVLAGVALLIFALSLMPAPFAESGMVDAKSDFVELGRVAWEWIQRAISAVR